jgi:hypothetical protein
MPNPNAAILGLSTDLELEVDDRPLPPAIKETIIAIGLTLTVTGSSTLTATAKDPQHLLVKSGWFGDMHDGRGAEAFLDGLPFVACAFNKKVDEFTLEFEDRDFWLMKEGPHARDPVKVFRGSKTLQEFVKEQTQRLCPHTDFVCPQLDQVQPREPAQHTSSVEGAKGEPAPGISGSFKIGSSLADAEQKKMANILLGACVGAPPVVAVAIICAGLAESNLRNITTPNSEGSWGVLQGGSGAGKTAPNFPKTPNDQTAKEMAESFVNGGRGFQDGGAAKLAREGQTDPGQIAFDVEKGGTVERFNSFRAEAEAIIKAYGGNPGSSSEKTITTITPEFFELCQKVATLEEPEEEDELEENALSGIEALLKPGKWLLWKVGNTFYLYTERELARLKAVVVLSEESKGILDIGYKLDHSRKKVSTVIIECRAQEWAVPPGQLVSFDDSVGEEISRDNDGKIRKWIVKNIERRDITDNATTIELILPEAGKREKAQSIKELTVISPPIAPNPKTGNRSSQVDAKGKLKAGSLLWQVYIQAKWIGEQGFYYLYGGGHQGFHATRMPSQSEEGNRSLKEEETGRYKYEEGLDCSGVLSWALHEAGLWGALPGKTTGRTNGEEIRMEVEQGRAVGPFDTLMFEKDWGEPGEGKYITLWVRNTAQSEHCFLWIQVPGSMRPEGGPDIDYALEASHPGATVPAPHGVGLRARLEYYADPAAEGFVARHWPGL